MSKNPALLSGQPYGVCEHVSENVRIVANLNLQVVNISLPTQVIPDYILAAPV